jgi:hypothetical protein
MRCARPGPQIYLSFLSAGVVRVPIAYDYGWVEKRSQVIENTLEPGSFFMKLRAPQALVRQTGNYVTGAQVMAMAEDVPALHSTVLSSWFDLCRARYRSAITLPSTKCKRSTPNSAKMVPTPSKTLLVALPRPR